MIVDWVNFQLTSLYIFIIEGMNRIGLEAHRKSEFIQEITDAHGSIFSELCNAGDIRFTDYKSWL